MRNPEQEFWEREATPNCIYVLQTTLDGISFETESVWASRDEAEKYVEARAHKYPEGSFRVYGVPCYGLLAEMLYRTGIGI